MRNRIIAITAALALTATTARAQIVTNGSFESPGAPGCPAFFGSVTGGFITGWTIGSGNIDYICSAWVADAGSISLDMNGSSAASLYQDLTLAPGSTYRLSFAMAENFFGGPATKTMDVGIGSIDFGSHSFNNPAATSANMGWVTFTHDFTANASTMRLTFASTTANCCWGPALDDVSVTLLQGPPALAPEPATLALLGSGLLGLAGFARRRRA